VNRILCTINIGRFLRPNVRRSFLAACERWGCEYFEIDEIQTPYTHFIDIKHDLCNFEQLQGKRVLYIDADAVIREDCPDPWQWVPEGYFAGVQNDQGALDQTSHYNQFMAWENMAEFLSPKPPYVGWGINGGLFMFEPERHRKLFATAKELYEASKHQNTDEQTGLSICVSAMGIPFYPLPCLFNCVGPRVFEAWPKLPAWITHYAKYGNHRRENAAELLDAAEWRRVQSPVMDDIPVVT
jgi:hypothetical protein